MKYLLTLLLLSAPVAALAQLHPQSSGTSQRLNGVDFYGTDWGWAVGDAGTVLHTSDSGHSWIAVPVGTSQPLNAVAIDYFDPLAVNIAGNGSTFIGTRDGLTWYRTTIPGASTLNAVDFPSISVGYVAGNNGALYRTSDSGHVWHKLSTSSSVNFYGLYWYDDSTGWVLGANGIALYTEDAGKTWETVPMGTTADLRAMSYGDDSTVWIVGNRVIVKSDDYAATFQSTISPYDLRDIVASSSTNAFAVGTTGRIDVTTDGTAWQLAPAITTVDLTSIVSPEGDDLFIVGDQGTILSTVDVTHSSVLRPTSEPKLLPLLAYPNPVASQLHLGVSGSDSPAVYRIFDAIGNEITKLDANSDRGLDVTNYPSGLYHCIKIIDGQAIASGSFTVMH
jgi:photosystem II stability/assembly factor-like uncharacterized protein